MPNFYDVRFMLIAGKSDQGKSTEAKAANRMLLTLTPGELEHQLSLKYDVAESPDEAQKVIPIKIIDT